MPTLEDKESSATTKVLALLDKQIAHLNLLHPEDEHPVVGNRVFDRSVALKVWSEFRRVFGAAAKSRDFAGLSEAIEAFVRAGVEKAAGIEFLSLFYELLNALRKHQKDAMAASELFKFLDALSYVYARTSLLAQCTTIRLRSRPQVLTDSEVSKLAHQEVMGYFAELLQSRRQPKVHV